MPFGSLILQKTIKHKSASSPATDRLLALHIVFDIMDMERKGVELEVWKIFIKYGSGLKMPKMKG